MTTIGVMTSRSTAVEIQARLDRLRWYHTIDVVPDARTRGWFDLRHALPLLPWPDVRGKRCLDIGTWDGFYAFELERRGAREVVAIDVEDLAEIDYPPEVRTRSGFDHSQTAIQPRSAGFHLLHEILGSRVQWHGVNVYDLDPGQMGAFDVVILGSLLVHLRDPVRALDAVRRVTSGHLLCIDYIHPIVNLLSLGRPLFQLRGEHADFQWWLPSDAGLRQLLHVGGFTIADVSRRFLLRPGPDGTVEPLSSWRRAGAWLSGWVQTGDRTRGGHMHRAYLARPRF